ncbi:MAG: SIS domain-containing protein [Phycisphaerae bacterium]|nr:SIS domain-containing protein [Phycisphaerae bacterium]
MSDTIKKRFDEHTEVLNATIWHLGDKIQAAADLIIESYRNGGGVFLFGNGGSAADAQHIAGELVGRFLINRPALKAQALSTDTSTITCIANDFSYDEIFSRQLEGNAVAGDVAIGLSTSGNSGNVVAALQYAKSNGLKTIAFTKNGGGKCAALADVLLDIPSDATPRVQEIGMLVYHILCEIVEAAMAETD